MRSQTTYRQPKISLLVRRAESQAASQPEGIVDQARPNL
jgi:hypothetical protein